MKHQHPKSNIQRRSKNQAPKSATLSNAVASNGSYGEVVGGGWVLKDEGNAVKAARHAFDLEERTTKFGEAIVRFSKKIPRDPANDRFIGQIVGCGTSVGANYCEANEGVSKKDFRNTIGRCVKEAKETKFFLHMVVASEPALANEARTLYREAKELHLIFAAIYRK